MTSATAPASQTHWVLLATSRPETDAAELNAWLAAVRELPGRSEEVADADAGQVLPGSVADAGISADLRINFRTEKQALEEIPAVADLLDSTCMSAVEALALNVVAARRIDIDGPRVKRTLALTVRDGVPDRDIQRFERSLIALPDHIREIRSWSLSRVDPARSTGPWTHVWEQEYTDIDGVRVAYLQHPYHWTGVDRWFDAEMPCSIVQPKLAHLFRWVDRPVVAGEQ